MDTIVWMFIALGAGFLAYVVYSGQLKWLLTVVRNGVLGIVGILGLNAILTGVLGTGIAVGVNVITVLVVGLLGLPGFVLLYASQVLVS